MKKVFLTLLVFFVSCPVMRAQHEGAVRLSADSTTVSLNEEMALDLGRYGDIVVESFRSNTCWFVDVLGGAGFYAAECNRFSQSFISRCKPQAQIGIGKWIQPAWALRLAGGAGSFRGDYGTQVWWNMYEQTDHETIPEEALPYYYKDDYGREWYNRTFKYFNLELDVMYDLTREFSRKMDTPYDLYLYGGPGMAFSFPSQGFAGNKALSFNLGGQMDIHLNKNFGIKLQLQGTIVDECLDGKIAGNNNKYYHMLEGYATAMVGVSFRFGHRAPATYKNYNEVVLDRTYNMLPIKEKAGEYNEYKAPFIVRFYIDQYNIEPDQELNITKVCRYLEQHPDARLLMTGHCDPETANPIYNQALSERRCQSVLKYIDQHFNIDHSRIDVKPMGDREYNFSEDFRWNRCVILTILED